jgi:Protein of unknown function (DUF2442)
MGGTMWPRVIAVEVIKPYVIEVTFEDGIRQRMDLEFDLRGEVFEPLKDPKMFAQATVESAWGTVSWPTGADLSPEFLYERRLEAVGRKD